MGGADASDTGTPFLDLHLSVLSGVCDWCCGFGFDIVYFPGLDGGVTRRASCEVCISRLSGFVGLVCLWLCGWFWCSRLVFGGRFSLADLSVSLASEDFFPDFIDVTVSWFLDSVSEWAVLFCSRACRDRSFVVACYGHDCFFWSVWRVCGALQTWCFSWLVLFFRGGTLAGVGFAVRAGRLAGCFGPLLGLGPADLGVRWVGLSPQ